MNKLKILRSLLRMQSENHKKLEEICGTPNTRIATRKRIMKSCLVISFIRQFGGIENCFKTTYRAQTPFIALTDWFARNNMDETEMFIYLLIDLFGREHGREFSIYRC